MESGRVKKSVIILMLVAVALLGLFAWTQYFARIEAEERLGLDASRVVAEHFSNAAALKVGTLNGKTVARAQDDGFMGIVKSEQTTSIPFTVDYFVNLSRLGEQSYDWDPENRTLTVAIPDVTVAEPNIDETAARSAQSGLYISRRASMDLARETSQRAAARSKQAAQKPENLDKARANARAVVGRMAQGPLSAAGLGDVQVVVRFPWEPKAGSEQPVQRWDQSRRPEEVLKERQEQSR